jgi:hypothetical protein
VDENNSSSESTVGTAGTAGAAGAVGTAGTDLKPGRLSPAAWRDIALYGLARVLVFVVLTVVIQSVAILMGMGQSFPLLMSALLALIVALPLSMLLFKKLRLRVNEQIAVRDAGRRAHKEQMRAQLEERLD